MIRSVVSVVRCPDYSPEYVKEAVSEALELAGLKERVSGSQRILLKPNLLSARRPEDAVTTHPSLVEALGKIAQEAGCSITIGDSPPFAGENSARYARLCELTGITAAADKLGAPVSHFEESVSTVSNPNGRFYKSFEIANAVLDADLIVNIPKLKTHGLTGMSGAIKNLFGCIPGIRKGLFHVQAAEDPAVFAQMLLDLFGALGPSIHVMDAVVAMEGEGPNSGAPRQVGLVLASWDPVALDAVACTITGFDPMSIDTTRLADEQNLGCADMAAIEIRGERPESVAVAGFKQSSGKNDWAALPGPIRSILRGQLVAAPRVSSTKCVGCGDCARACPVHAIIPGKPPAIDLGKCIRCYCCHEVCDHSAVELRLGWIGKLAFRVFRKT